MWVYCLYRPTTPFVSKGTPKINGRAQHTWRIRNQNRNQHPIIIRIKHLRLSQGLVDTPSLAPRTHRVQHEESIIPQPRQEPRGAAHDVGHVVAVTVHLGHRPSNEHAGVGQRHLRGFEEIGYAPDEKDTRGDLDDCCEEGATQEACWGVGLVTYFVSSTGDSGWKWEYTENNVHDLQQRQRLRPFSILADTGVDILTARRRKCEDGAAEDTEPKKAGDGVVGD